MQPDAELRSRLHDIIERCDAIAFHLADLAFEEFAEKRTVRSAVERELITIGEAMRMILQTAPAIAESVTDPRGIVDLRNVLVHGYRNLDVRTVWTIAKTEVPLLLSEVRTLFASGAGQNPA